jgi:hypothetical protein
VPGVYFFRVRAEGYSTKGGQFTREKTLTAGVYYGNYSVKPQTEPGDLLCDLLHCTLEEHKVLKGTAIEHLTKLGIDVKRFIECVEEVCPDLPKERIPLKKRESAKHFPWKPQLISEIRIGKLNLSKSVKGKPKNMDEMKQIAALRKKKEADTMFTQLDLKKEEEANKEARKKVAKKK